MEAGAFGVRGAVTLKLELLQHAGSFKPRGAFNRVLAADVPAAGLVAASGGNHGVAVAHVARALGHRAEIFVPSVSAPAKVARIRALGADGDGGRRRLRRRPGRRHRPRRRHRRAARAPATTTRWSSPARARWPGSSKRQAPGTDTVLVAVGGGGLIAGVAAWFGDRVKIVSVEPAADPGHVRGPAGRSSRRGRA